MSSDLIVYTKPKSSISENIRTIRTNLEFTGIKGETNILLVTSSISGEGKSFISSNLAASFAQSGKKVLLVDCDIRKGRQHEIFKISEKNIGLSNLLIDDALVEETIKEVYSALEEKGYNPVNQIVGYIISGDPGYISTYMESRKKISKFERTQIVEVLLRNYMK